MYQQTKCKLVVGLVGLTGVAIAVVTIGRVEAQSGGIEMHYVMQNKATAIDIGQPGPSQGDRDAESGTIFDRDGKEVGQDLVDCVLVPPPTHYQCSAALMLPRGQLAVLGGADYDPAHPFSMAVVGGTGNYAGAAGVVDVTTLAENRYQLDIHLR